MANIAASEHRKKRRSNVAKSSPFPVPITSLTDVASQPGNWFYFTGHLKEDCVEVVQSGDIHYLYTMGFFGRGLVSRGAPELHQNLQNFFIPTGDGDTEVIKIMKRRMYLRHKQWQKARDSSAESSSGPDLGDLEEFDSDVDYPDRTGHYDPAVDMEQGQPIVIEEEDTDTDILGLDTKSQFDDGNQVKQSQDEPTASWDTADADVDSWGPGNSSEKSKPSAVDDWENAEGDHDFWGTSNDTEITKENSENTVSYAGNMKRSDGTIVDSARKTEDVNFEREDMEDAKENSEKVLFRNDQEICKDVSQSEKSCTSVGAKKHAFDDEHETGSEINQQLHKKQKTCDMKTEERESARTDSDSELKSEDNDNTVIGVNSSAVTDDISRDDIMNIDVEENEDETAVAKEKLLHKESVVVLTEDQDMDTNEGELSLTDSLPLHPCCMEEDPEGEYLVIDDSDCDEKLMNVPSKRTSVWRPVRKMDTYPYVEPLILSLEEAFFLSYGLGCLTVWDENGAAMALGDMWCQFCCRKQRFLPSYVAYHYFRSKGWVPKSGVTFGVDYILYREGPPFYHSSYSVIVRTVFEGDYMEVPEFVHRPLTWTSLSGLNRVTEYVSKTLMFCYVIMPRKMTKDELQTPQCLSRFKIKLHVISRWVSSQEREKDKDLE